LYPTNLINLRDGYRAKKLSNFFEKLCHLLDRDALYERILSNYAEFIPLTSQDLKVRQVFRRRIPLLLKCMKGIADLCQPLPGTTDNPTT
jgi:hypothetical protein